MSEPWTVLVVAKAPVPGRAKTRLAAHVGAECAADLAAAALLDTMDAVLASGARGHLCLAGDLADGARGDELGAATRGWSVTPQRGDGFAERLVAAHADAGAGLVVQVGMDTPQVTGALLRTVAEAASAHDVVLGMALDGGWWTLARHDARAAAALAGVPMSTPTTGEDTERALVDAGLSVGRTVPLLDVDTFDDAQTVAEQAPTTRFAQAWRSRAEVVR